MSALLRNSGVLLLVLGLAACQPPEPPVLAPAAKATAQPARQPAANDDLDPMARTPIVDPPSAEESNGDNAPPSPRLHWTMPAKCWLASTWGPEVTGAVEGTGRERVLRRRLRVLRRQGLPPGVSMMTDDDRVVRFDLKPGDDPELPVEQPGPFGLRIGMTRAQAMAQFPKPPVSSPHAYDGDQGEYLTWQDPGSDLGIRLELFEGKVTRMYWGTSDAIELIEGCA